MVSTATLSSARLGGILELAGRSVPYRELASRLEDRQRISGTAVHQRLLTLWRLATTQAPVAVVTSLRALLEHTIPPEDLARRGRTLRAGDRLSWAETAEWLFDLGYEPVTEVSEPGTFSRRGGIIDIYPASAEQPARVELFGDE